MLTFTAHLQQSHVKKIDGGRPFVGNKEAALIESLKSPKKRRNKHGTCDLQHRANILSTFIKIPLSYIYLSVDKNINCIDSVCLH